MRLIAYADPSDFLRDNRAYLEQREVVTGLILGLAVRLQGNQFLYGDEQPFLAAVHSVAAPQQPVLCALMTPPHNLLLYSHLAVPDGVGQDGRLAGALEMLADHLAGRLLPGVNGPQRASEAFAELWQRRTGATRRGGMEQRIYELRQVCPPLWAPGYLRQARPAEEDLCYEWTVAFQVEAGLTFDRARLRDFTTLRVANGELYLWDDGGPVSMALRTRPTAHGISIGGVYTPPALRRRGYATSCVAALSQALLDMGHDYCSLFTDLSNPTSNDIYQQIGYVPACDFREIRFG